jgi:hypothetical protein
MRFDGPNDPIETLAYPATTAEIVEQYGDRELELRRGSERLGDVLGRLGSERFDSPAEVRLSIRSAVGAGAIGRRMYSDRDPPTVGEDGPAPRSL